MRYHALACDYDGTIALHGHVDQPTLDALEDVRKSGRKLILVTGRELDELLHLLPDLRIFDRIVAENGALLYRPETREEVLLAEAPPLPFAEELIRRGARDVSIGRVIVATWEPHQKTALEVIHDLGLELQVIFNKGAVMVLPSGVNKATGLTAALLELGLSPHNVAGVGDAENDHAFLAMCECSIAVSNALDTLKQRVDWVTKGDHGIGIVELVHELMTTDLSPIGANGRHNILLGKRASGVDVHIRPYGSNVLIAGTSGGGKSTLATGFLERVAEKGYQYVVIDPEGDYSTMLDAIVLGDSERPASISEVMDLLARPDQNVIVNLFGIDRKQRPDFFEKLLPRLQELRARTGRPHWILADETHHVLPLSWESAGLTVSQNVYSMMFVTLEPDRLAQPLLSSIDVVIASGEKPGETLKTFSDMVGAESPQVEPTPLEPGQSLAWFWREGGEPFPFTGVAPKAERRRHRRKYAEGELPPEQSFYFRGPENKLNLRAQNLNMFLQLAEGVDDETWLYHLQQGDYSTWFRRVIKDPELAEEIEQLRLDPGTNAARSRKVIRGALEQRYILV